MNGNIKKVDDAVNKFGKRREFMIIQNNIADALAGDSYALACYIAIWRRANSEFNLTVDNIRGVLKCSKATASKALETLKDKGLLREKFEQDITGVAFRKRRDGRPIPNKSKVYTIHSSLKSAPQQSQMLTQGTFIATEFTADEINEAAQETVSEVTQEQQQIEPPQVVQEMPPHEYTPPPTPTQKPIYKNADIQALIERRKQHIYNIAATQGVFSKTQKAMLLTWIERFKSEVKRPADDDDITHIANLIGGDNKDLEKLLTGYIADRIPQEKAV